MLQPITKKHFSRYLNLEKQVNSQNQNHKRSRLFGHEWDGHLCVVGDDSDAIGVDLVLEGEVAKGVGDGLEVVLDGELLAGAVDDGLNLGHLQFNRDN